MGRKRAPGTMRESWAIRRTLPVPISGSAPSADTRSATLRNPSIRSGREHHRVPGVFPGKHGADRQTVRQQRRHVLAAVHGKIDVPSQERVFDFLDEEALPAVLGQRPLLQADHRMSG